MRTGKEKKKQKQKTLWKCSVPKSDLVPYLRLSLLHDLSWFCFQWNCFFFYCFFLFFSFEKSWQEPSPNLFACFHTYTVWWVSEMWSHCCHDLHVIDRCDRLQLWMMIQIIVVCWCVLTCRPCSVSPVAGHHDHTNWGIILTVASISLSAAELLWYVIHAISIFEKLVALHMQCLCA